MTPEERAEECMHSIGHIGDGSHYDDIVAAITAAVEEEREACKQIAHNLRNTFKAELAEGSEAMADMIAEAIGDRGTA